MPVLTPRELYERYAPSLAYIEVESADGVRIGSAFHVGEGVFVTARHVVARSKLIRLANTTDQHVADPEGNGTINGKPGTFRLIPAGEGQVVSGPHFHPDPAIDVAAVVVKGLEVPPIRLGSHLDDMLNDEAFLLRSVLIMGYPPVPFSREPLLIAARAEVNAVVDKYTGGHPHFVISAMPRGGFSGGVCLIEWNFALGVITESLITQGQATELGFMAVLTVEPIFECLSHNRILPSYQKEGWDGLWDKDRS
ncbi:MAG TPA: serine protease [Isosphaeraceae bacterium]|jgi:hypothetical protein|nr:serine protease [Isosphaeraceae bacterium]